MKLLSITYTSERLTLGWFLVDRLIGKGRQLGKRRDAKEGIAWLLSLSSIIPWVAQLALFFNPKHFFRVFPASLYLPWFPKTSSSRNLRGEVFIG
jgi:hypothetical protein